VPNDGKFYPEGTTNSEAVQSIKAAVADFEQRWQQRGKTTDCSFMMKIDVNFVISFSFFFIRRQNGQTL